MQRKFNFNKLFNGLVEGVPILVLGNKNDLPNALNENGIIQAMELSNIKDRIVPCYSKNLNNIDNVLKWLSNVKVKK